MSADGSAPTAPISISEYRDLATALLEHAANHPHGRGVRDPLYQSICEGRDPGVATNRYSSCGDLAHWMLTRLGVRLGFLNRAELAGTATAGWRSGLNVSRLAWAREARDGSVADIYYPGDILIIWARPDTTDAHVMCVLEHRQGDGILRCSEAGQSHGASTDPRVKHRNHVIAVRGTPESLGVQMRNRIYVTESNRAIMRWLPLEAVLERAAAEGKLADVNGAEVRAAIADGSLR